MSRNNDTQGNQAQPGPASAERASTQKPRKPRQPKKLVPKQKKRPAWRPTQLTKKLADEIAGYIEQGFDYKTSYEAAGISKTAFFNYLRHADEIESTLNEMYEEAIERGEEDDFEVELTEKQELHLYFLKVVSEAKAKAKAANIACLMRNAQATLDPETGEMLDPGNFKAAIEYLRRRDPAEWGDTDKREVTIKTDEETKRALESGVIVVPHTGTGLTQKEMSNFVQERQQESMRKAREGAGEE